jgi:hypothetical protein
VNSRDFQQVAENQKFHLVEGSIPSETEKQIADTVGASNVEALAPTTRETKRELWLMIMNLD